MPVDLSSLTTETYELVEKKAPGGKVLESPR